MRLLPLALLAAALGACAVPAHSVAQEAAISTVVTTAARNTAELSYT